MLLNLSHANQFDEIKKKLFFAEKERNEENFFFFLFGFNHASTMVVVSKYIYTSN